MSTPVNDLDRDDVVIALRREGAAQPVRPAPVEQVTAQARRRRARRRASVAVVSTAAALLVGAVAIGALADGPRDRVRTAAEPTVPNGPGIHPLLVPGTASGFEREAEGLPAPSTSELDLLDASGERAPWWRWGSEPQWSVGGGVVLADGRRFATAQDAPDGGQEGELVLVELDDLGGVQRAIPLGVEVPPDPKGPQDPNDYVSAEIIGATGPRIDVLVSRETIPPFDPSAAAGRPIITETSLVSVDVETGAVETVIDDLADSSHRTAGDRIVSVRAAVSKTEPCLLDVRGRVDLEEVRTVEVACDAPGSPLPPMVRVVALDPTGRFAAVERTTLTTGLSELSLLVVDLDDETTTEVITASGAVPWTALTWDASGRLRLAMTTDNPDAPPADVPALPGGPEIEVVHYRSD